MVGIPGDTPVVFVDKPVVERAEKDQIVEVGGSSLSPMLNVVDLEPPGVATSGIPAAATVTVDDQSS